MYSLLPKKKVTVHQYKQQMVSTETQGKRPEYFLKNKMFCTVLKGCEVASEIIRILLLGLLLVQRAASLMSNNLDTDLTSWHGHKPSWHCQPPLETDNIGFYLGYLQGSGKQVNHLPFFSCSLKLWNSKIKANYMPQIKYQTTNDIYYSGNVKYKIPFSHSILCTKSSISKDIVWLQ